MKDEPGTISEAARLYEEKKEFGKARDLYEKVVAIKPKDARAWGDLADMFKKQKKFRKAAYYYGIAFGLDPEYARNLDNIIYCIYQNAASLEKRGEAKQALAQYRRAAALDPSNPWAEKAAAAAASIGF